MKVKNLVDSDCAMIFHHKLDGLMIRVRQIRRCTKKGLFKSTVMGIFIIINITLTKRHVIVIDRLFYIHSYHAAIFVSFFYSFESYLCVVF